MASTCMPKAKMMMLSNLKSLIQNKLLLVELELVANLNLVKVKLIARMMKAAIEKQGLNKFC